MQGDPTEAGSDRWRALVGIDGSDHAAHALAWARSEAELHGGVLDVLHVWAPPAPVTEVAAMAATGDEALYRQAAEDLLAGALAGVEAGAGAALEVRSSVVRGYAPTVLLERASDADLLVVGSRGLGGFTGLLLGSVSQQCLHHTRRPIACIPANAALPGTGDVVVGVDGSEGSWAALRWAIDEAGRRGARLAVVHGWATPYPLPPGGVAVAPLHESDFRGRSLQLLHEMVDGTVARAERRPAEVELLPVDEPAAPAVLQRAKGAELIVVGGRGRGGIKGLLLGSVSQQVVHHAPCAVVVIPHVA